MKLPKGLCNDITDVPGVRVGHVTLYHKMNNQETICTGITSILPHEGNIFKQKVPAAVYVINGFGKTVGLVQVEELGVIESPILLTNTLSVGTVLQGTLQHMLQENPEIGDTTGTINIVVGECNDGYLNSIRIPAIKQEHAIEAIQSAKSGPIKQGAIGAGKGMVCFDYKGGIGSASRMIAESYTVGCLVLSNFGKRQQAMFANWQTEETVETPDGSIMMIIATNAPLDARQLKRLAKRCSLGLGRTGSIAANGSGDIAIAFSTKNMYTHESVDTCHTMHVLRDDDPLMEKIFQAVIETTEEAIINSLKFAETTTGRQGRVVKRAPL
ncbi:P1 family peptidase [Virgibacillus soli]|uniref:P1 family peptidase n=1 Tax=Paracerasibacillus soli TaxID=480284 RepID=A0ABU5CPX6_9BACI|nr:P1 family peptidase [Virgibacillus soli]MDY0407513.1 P1 family peptidase [Virgibacillus soli]